MADKVPCIIPGCTRGIMEATARKRWGTANVSFICGKHWQRLTKAERRVWARIGRLRRKFGIEHLGDREWRIWSALARRAANG